MKNKAAVAFFFLSRSSMKTLLEQTDNLLKDARRQLKSNLTRGRDPRPLNPAELKILKFKEDVLQQELTKLKSEEAVRHVSQPVVRQSVYALWDRLSGVSSGSSSDLVIIDREGLAKLCAESVAQAKLREKSKLKVIELRLKYKENTLLEVEKDRAARVEARKQRDCVYRS